MNGTIVSEHYLRGSSLAHKQSISGMDAAQLAHNALHRLMVCVMVLSTGEVVLGQFQAVEDEDPADMQKFARSNAIEKMGAVDAPLPAEDVDAPVLTPAQAVEQHQIAVNGVDGSEGVYNETPVITEDTKEPEPAEHVE